MKKFMLDTQIYDLIIAVPGFIEQINRLTSNGEVEILCTHIQNDELFNIQDAHKRAEVARIKRRQVTTAGAVYGISKYGMATYGNGSSSGISLNQIRSSSKQHTKDALIATTASRDADVLVTEDKRFFKKFNLISTSCNVWSFDKFKAYILNL